MINSKILSLFVFAICVGSASAQKKFESNSYLDFGYSMMTYSEGSTSLKPTGIRAIYGQNTAENFGWEALLGLGMNEDAIAYPRATIGVKISSVLGVYAKGYVKPSDSFELFGRLGFANMSRTGSCAPSATCTAAGVAASQTDSGNSISYGAGVKFEVSKNISIIADYMSYYNRSDISVNATTLGVSYGF